MNRKALQELSALRLKEAKTLLQSHCWEGAYYLGGYAVECALKAHIAKRTERHDFPDKDRVNASYTHDLDKLAFLAGLTDELVEAKAAGSDLHVNWKVVTEWWEHSRYERPSQADAENLLDALTERKHGVLRWLRQHW